ncbi:MAG TPA: transposase [Solirubrobacteraceae bacterium]|nr:transposase [Solirubrobacteraceae bacterium]
MPDAIHHVYARGNRRQRIFVDDDDRLAYLELLGRAVDEFDWSCLAYCLMGNHVHLLLGTPQPNLGTGIGLLHGLYAQRFNRRHDVWTHLFHRPFGSKRARDDATVMYFATYIALNPVRAGIAPRAEDYRWSSHAATIGRAEVPAWLDSARLLTFFATRAGRVRYAAVVEAVAAMGAAGFDAVTAERSAAQLARAVAVCRTLVAPALRREPAAAQQEAGDRQQDEDPDDRGEDPAEVEDVVVADPEPFREDEPPERGAREPEQERDDPRRRAAHVTEDVARHEHAADHTREEAEEECSDHARTVPVRGPRRAPVRQRAPGACPTLRAGSTQPWPTTTT